MGYRHIDTSPAYGNEKDIGQAITDLIEEGVITRGDLFVTSKLWCTRHRPDLVEVALKATLSDLQIDYLDLYLIHWPMAFKGSVSLFCFSVNSNFIFTSSILALVTNKLRY